MKIETLARLLLFPLAFAMTLALAPAHLAQAQALDGDLDGVDDATDQCLDTPAGDLVDATGCSVCPCEGSVDGTPWAAHKAYVDCVVGAAHTMRAARELTRKEMKAAVKRARKSTCGTVEMTRCCVYPSLDTDADVIVGRCRLTTVDVCDQLTVEMDNAEDAGPGSCMPNPCVF